LVKKARQAGVPFGEKAMLASRETLRFTRTFLEKEKETKNERGTEKGKCFFRRLDRGKA